MNKTEKQIITLESVTLDNAQLAKELQATIFPNEISPKQVDTGIVTKNPQNYVAFYEGDDKPVGIVGFYLLENVPKHVLLNWYGVLPNQRRKGYGKEILSLAIKEARKLYKDADYLTFYTSKTHNKEAIILYKKMGFVVKDYCNEEDISNIAKVQADYTNDYVIGIYKLTSASLPDFKAINLNIANEINILKSFLGNE